ncbi:MAG: hypothetical protein JWN66_3008 [Sphingomonas bacterium]|uniref:hypothetical protein n=1 Tax=Sphingomonas bacterium TaxID=1895847 RepID=UPI00262138AC|nr:hypothetical protein [Sphingomonas bacterium]MDB5705892.1 hypothetical protein [Sphingomonas bacterium]
MSDYPAAARRVRGPVAAHFLAHHALSPADAIDFAPKDRIERWWFDRFRRIGALREVAPGRYWFDLVAYHLDAQAFSKRWVPIAMGVSLAIAAVAMLFYRG